MARYQIISIVVLATLACANSSNLRQADLTFPSKMTIASNEASSLFAVLGEECAENLFYGNEQLSLTGTTDGHSNYLSTILANEEHDKWLQVITSDGTTEVVNIIWSFQQKRSLADRLSNAVANGEAVHYEVTDLTAGSKYEYDGEWWFSNRAGVISEMLTTASPSSCCFSMDDGLWGAASGTIDGDESASVPSNFWGIGVYTGTADSTSCTFLYRNGDGISLPSMKTYMYLYEAPPTASPTSLPSSVPSSRPTGPTEKPTPAPTANPTFIPSLLPSSVPTAVPSSRPTVVPTREPTSPTSVPTSSPSSIPSSVPTSSPSEGIGPWLCDKDTYSRKAKECTKPDNNSTSTTWSPCVPGYSIIGLGIDSTTGNLKKRVWDSPLEDMYYSDGVGYRAPNNFILNDEQETQEWIEKRSSYFSSIKSFQTSFGAEYGIDTAQDKYKGQRKEEDKDSVVRKGMGIEAGFANTIEKNIEGQFLSVRFRRTTYVLSAEIEARVDGMMCHSEFYDEVMKLPTEYDYRPYFFILANYGTHVVNAVKMGGEIEGQSTMSACSVTTKEATDATVSMAAQQYSKYLESSAAITDESAEFEGIRVSKEQTTVRGGDHTGYTSKGYEAWVQSLASGDYDLQALEYNVIPMYELMGDPARRDNMELAFYNYHKKRVEENSHSDTDLADLNSTNIECPRGNGYIEKHWPLTPLLALVLTVSTVMVGL